jgi:outer membrane protein TolC
MKNLGSVAVCLVVTLATAWGAEPGPEKLDLPTLITRARHSPAPRAAAAAAHAAHAKVDEVARMWVPQLELTLVGGPSPEIKCLPSAAECTHTDNSEAGTAFSGLFFRVDAKAAMPIYTFGKLSAGSDAAEEGAHAADALASAAQNDAALDAARAYYAVKLARELVLMLDEGKGDLDDALKKVEKQLDQGSGDVTESDRHRLRAFRAEIDARLSEARKLEGVGLAGVRLFSGLDDVDVDAAPLSEAPYDLGTRADARTLAERARPERQAALAGAAAADHLADVESRRWWPDLIGVAQVTLARAAGADDPQNAFANDPYNVTSFAAGLALRWVLDPGVRPAKVEGARADAARARATADFATSGVTAEADKAWAEARDAKDRLQASRLGEKEARAWLVSTLQSVQAGLAEPKDLADALLAWFNMRARVLQALFDWDVGAMTLARATGQLR